LSEIKGVTVRVRALLVSLVAAATCVITGTSAGHPPAALAHGCGHPRGTFIAYGHSYPASPRIGGVPASYATLAAAAPRVKPVVRAKDGDTTVDVEKLVHNALRRTLTTFTARPVPVTLLVRPLQVNAADHPGQAPEVISTYADRQRNVAERFSAVRGAQHRHPVAARHLS
jgi:hypothetical protein